MPAILLFHGYRSNEYEFLYEKVCRSSVREDKIKMYI